MNMVSVFFFYIKSFVFLYKLYIYYNEFQLAFVIPRKIRELQINLARRIFLNSHPLLKLLVLFYYLLNI